MTFVFGRTTWNRFLHGSVGWPGVQVTPGAGYVTVPVSPSTRSVQSPEHSRGWFGFEVFVLVSLAARSRVGVKINVSAINGQIAWRNVPVIFLNLMLVSPRQKDSTRPAKTRLERPAQ